MTTIPTLPNPAPPGTDAAQAAQLLLRQRLCGVLGVTAAAWGLAQPPRSPQRQRRCAAAAAQRPGTAAPAWLAALAL